MSTPIRIGLVGLGRAGWGMHTQELIGKESMFQIVAACDVIKERVDGAAVKYGCKAYLDVAELVKDPDVELVDIATRSNDHVDHARLALEAGKMVLLEKPIAANAAQAKELRALFAKYPGKMFVRHNRRFDPDFVKVRDIIASGILGDVYEIRLARHNYQRRDDWQAVASEGGGQLLNWGPHIVDHALRFLESPVKDIYADLKTVSALGDAEDHVKIVLRGENGRVVDLEISGGVTVPAPLYHVLGTKGTLWLDAKVLKIKYLDPKQVLQAKTADPGTPANAGIPYHVATKLQEKEPVFGNAEVLHWIETEEPAPQGDNYVVWDHLYASIREGKTYPITHEEALGVIDTICKAKAIAGWA